MTISGSKSAENRLNEAILSVNTAIFAQIYRYITHNNHYQQRSDYVDQEGYHGYVPGNDFRAQEASRVEVQCFDTSGVHQGGTRRQVDHGEDGHFPQADSEALRAAAYQR